MKDLSVEQIMELNSSLHLGLDIFADQVTKLMLRAQMGVLPDQFVSVRSRWLIRVELRSRRFSRSQVQGFDRSVASKTKVVRLPRQVIIRDVT